MTPERAKQICEAAEAWRFSASDVDFITRVLEGRPKDSHLKLQTGSDYVEFVSECYTIFRVTIPGLWDLIASKLQEELAERHRRMEALELKEAE